MPLILSELRAQTAPFAIVYGDATLTGTYFTQAFTPELEDLMNSQAPEANPSAPFLAAFCRLVASWDLIDVPGPKGQPVPITPEALGEVPSALLIEIMRKIGEEQRPNP